MKRLILFLVFTVTFVACEQNEEAPHLPREKMVDILSDIHMAETYSTMVNDSMQRTTNKNLDSLAVYYAAILEHYKVSVEEFDTSMFWYRQHPEELDSVYTRVMTRVNELEGTNNPLGK